MICERCKDRGYYWLIEEGERQQVICTCIAGLRYGLREVKRGTEDTLDEARQRNADEDYDDPETFALRVKHGAPF